MSNIRLPADFGLNKLRSKHHGNILVNLSGGKKIWANSVILALNSPVIERMFGETEQAPQLDLSEYSRAAVIQFIEAVYTGQLKLDTVLFRDVHKLAFDFEVSWLQKRCEGYLEKLISQAVQDDYDSVYYLLEETRQTAELTQDRTLLNIVIEKISSNFNKSDFVTRYMADYITLSTSQLDIMIFVSRDQPTLLVKIVIQHIESNKLMFDEATKYILTNLDLLSCLIADKDLYDCLFDLLFEKVVNLSFDDLKLIVTLHKSTFEAYLATIKAGVTSDGSDKETSNFSSSLSQTTISKSITIDSLPIISGLKSTDNDVTTASSTDSSLEGESSSSLPALHTPTSSLSREESYFSTSKTSNLPIISPETLESSQSLYVPNLFHSVKSLQGRLVHGMVALNSLLHSDNVANLFMVIEALPHLPNLPTYQAIEAMITAKRRNNWARIPPKFLESFSRQPHTHLIQQIKKTLGLCSVRDTVQLESKNFTTLHDLMRKGGPVHFQFSVRLGGGKFTINVQPASKMDIQKNFDIKLQETTNYQSQGMSGDKLHLAVKEWDRHHGNRVLNRHVTWCGRPSVTWCGRNREKKGRLSWGEISEFRRIKIVVYCDVRQIAKR